MGPYPKDASQLSIKFEQQNGLESLLTVCLPTELSSSKPLVEVRISTASAPRTRVSCGLAVGLAGALT